MRYIASFRITEEKAVKRAYSIGKSVGGGMEEVWRISYKEIKLL